MKNNLLKVLLASLFAASLASCGEAPVSIKSVAVDSTNNLIVTLTDGTTQNLGSVVGKNGANGTDGKGITSVAKTNTIDNVDYYTITFTDNSTFQFQITNGSVTEVEPVTFAQQLEMAGITFTYENPNAALNSVTTTGNADYVTGSSVLTDKYTAGSYKNVEELYARSQMKYFVYSWAESTATTDVATTLAEAAALANAKYVSDVFPADGKAYEIKKTGNLIYSASLATLETTATGTALNSAYFGMSCTKINGEVKVYLQLSADQTFYNILKNGTGFICWTEYLRDQITKNGVGNRNYGCRMEVSLDTANSYFFETQGKNPYATSADAVTVGMTPEVGKYNGMFCVLTIDKFLPLG